MVKSFLANIAYMKFFRYGSQYVPRSIFYDLAIVVTILPRNYEILSRSYEMRSRSYEILSRSYERLSRSYEKPSRSYEIRLHLVTTKSHL